MARIRSIKPDLPQDRKLAAVLRDARLLFIYGLTIADDEGFFRAELPHLKTLFPYDDDLTPEGLARLSRDLLQLGMWRERWTRDGCRVIEIVNWAKHQRIDHKSKSFIASELSLPVEAPSRDVPETVASPSRSRVLSLESLSPEVKTLVGLKPNGKAVARTYQAIQTHLAETLALVKAGQRERLAADEMRGIQAELVFAYWQAKCGHERALLDDKRLTRLKRCLHENGGNVHELLYAVDGWGKDGTFQRLADHDNRKLDGIDNIFRDRERIERLAGHSKAWRTEQAPHPMALKYLEGADVPAHQ
jgi:hypothetical protein